MSKKIRLHTSDPGSYEANHSMSPVPYRVDNNGDVEVDEEAVGPLLEKGGFTLVDPPQPVEVSNGMVQVINPTHHDASCSYRGVSYTADADGVLTVPCQAAEELLSHGFISVEAFTSLPAAPADEPVAVVPATVAPATPVEPVAAPAVAEPKTEPKKTEPKADAPAA